MKKIIAFLLAIAVVISLIPAAAAYDTAAAEKAAKAAAEAVKPDDPTLGSEWLMVADATYGYCGFGSSYRKTYYNNIKALLDENCDCTKEEIRRAISGNLCRCTGYEQLIEAIYDAAQELKAVKMTKI